jgi:hypothetical protein
MSDKTAAQTGGPVKTKDQGVNNMNNITTSNRVTATLSALLFSSIMVLSAVGPAEAESISAPHDTLVAKASTPAKPSFYLA